MLGAAHLAENGGRARLGFVLGAAYLAENGGRARLGFVVVGCSSGCKHCHPVFFTAI